MNRRMANQPPHLSEPTAALGAVDRSTGDSLAVPLQASTDNSAMADHSLGIQSVQATGVDKLNWPAEMPVSAPAADGSESLALVPWSPATQWLLAGLSFLALLLLVWRGWGLSSWSTRPILIERAVPSGDSPPRLVRGAAPDRDSPARRKNASLTPIDINRASEVELQLLPGIGPVLAQRIVAARAEKPFRSLDDLRRVRGIGVKTLEKLRPHATARPPD
jgi:competence protein ComEA